MPLSSRGGNLLTKLGLFTNSNIGVRGGPEIFELFSTVNFYFFSFLLFLLNFLFSSFFVFVILVFRHFFFACFFCGVSVFGP